MVVAMAMLETINDLLLVPDHYQSQNEFGKKSNRPPVLLLNIQAE